MKKYLPISVIVFALFSCRPGSREADTLPIEAFAFRPEQAEQLATLPLQCLRQEYPNKLGQVLGSTEDLGEPGQLHPAFFGCYDWHSSVHGHWSLVWLLKHFPRLECDSLARAILTENLSAEHILAEVEYFQGAHNTSYERTYGWAWLLKLAQELHGWEDPLGRTLEKNLEPLTELIVERYLDFLPRLVYPIRVGEHTNTAFGLTFARDYALATGHDSLLYMIDSRARDFYLADCACPLGWEPSGYDFLSPCLEEIDLMMRVLSPEEFLPWLQAFIPGLEDPGFHLEPGRVIDRSDGKLVHLDGLNFSRAWVLFRLAGSYPEYGHLEALAEQHLAYSISKVVGDSYEGGHWLASFAFLALDSRP